MGNSYKKRKRTYSDEENSETLEESDSLIRRKANDSPTTSQRRTFSEQLTPLTIDDVREILSRGNLSRMCEIDQWAVTAYMRNEWGNESMELGRAFGVFCCRRLDGASLNAVIHLPNFHLFATAIIRTLNPDFLKDDSFFLTKLGDALLAYLRPTHESHLRGLLLHAIVENLPMSVLEFIDRLWSKTISNNVQSIKDLYTKMPKEHENDVTFVALIHSVIHIGISRHICLMLDDINDTLHKDALSTYSKSKLLEWAFCSNSSINRIHVLKHIKSTYLALAKERNDERRFFTSQLAPHMCESLKPQSESIVESIVPMILKQMDSCARVCRTDEKTKAISWLLSEICKAMEMETPGATWKPILTGSAAECTQALFIDEFDYVMLTNSELRQFEDKLRKVVSKIQKTIHHRRLAIESIRLDEYRNPFPCLYIIWVDEHLRSTHISIDLVRANPLDWLVSLPLHNFIPLPRRQWPDYKDAHQRESIQGSNSIPRVFRLFIYDVPVFSQVENALIKALPPYVIKGYRFAKADRILHVIQPIIQKLIELGVTIDIHKLIRTYHLKTCVFYLTQSFAFDDLTIEENNWLGWAIAIYTKLREFIMLGDVREFFATERYMFRGNGQECKDDEEYFTASLPSFICCRRRKARLVIVDQILHVLHNAQSKYHLKSIAINRQAPTSGLKRPDTGKRVQALYSCEAEYESELSFEPNDVIINVRNSKEPGWLEGYLGGKFGLIPANYVVYID